MCGINAHELLNDGVSVDASFLQQKVLRCTVAMKDTTRYSRYLAHKLSEDKSRYFYSDESQFTEAPS